jgi:hypothetical protein
MLHLGLDLCVSHNRIVAIYFFVSLSLLVVGLSLSLYTTQTFGSIYIGAPGIPGHVEFTYVRPYEDLGLGLYGFGIFLVAATFYQSLAGEKRTSKKSKIDIAKF